MTPDVLAQLHAKAFEERRAWSAEEFASLLQHQGAILRGDYRAFALLRVVADEAEVLTLATDPAHRRRGLARSALRDAEIAAAHAGCQYVFLEVAEDNFAALSLYEQTGYAPVGRRPDYYTTQGGKPVAALVLRKSLVSA